MAGPVYRYDPSLAPSRKCPVDFDGRADFAEWNTSQLGPAGTTVTSIDRVDYLGINQANQHFQLQRV